MPNSRNKDTCDCIGCCRYPNGPIQLMLAQILLFLGAIFSIESMIDCKFVDARIEAFPVLLFPESLETYLPTGGSRHRLGFFFWELENGDCSWHLDDDLTDDLIDDYIDFLGGDWRAPRGMGMTALVLSWIIWIWILVFTCLAHLRPVRYAVTALCLLILVVFQSVTFAVVTSDFCDDVDCKMGRGARFSIGSILCFILTAHLFLVTRDYPGGLNPVIAVAAAPAATGKGAGVHEEASPIDMEEQAVEHVEVDQPTEQVLNDSITNAQEIEDPSDPFVSSTDTLTKAVFE
jgi:hypothetical protein